MKFALSCCYRFAFFVSFYHRKPSTTERRHANTEPKVAGLLYNPLCTPTEGCTSTSWRGSAKNELLSTSECLQFAVSLYPKPFNPIHEPRASANCLFQLRLSAAERAATKQGGYRHAVGLCCSNRYRTTLHPCTRDPTPSILNLLVVSIVVPFSGYLLRSLI